jgi:hypothetical protein
MRTIAQQWTSFEAAVVPAAAGRVQRMEMRRAFYAGFQAALLATSEAAAECGDNDDLGASMIETLHRECGAFADAVARGRA